MAGWLASRLGWEIGENIYQLVHSESGHVPRARLTLKSGKRAIAIDLNAVPWKTNTPGDIYSITAMRRASHAATSPTARECRNSHGGGSRDRSSRAASTRPGTAIRPMVHAEPRRPGRARIQGIGRDEEAWAGRDAARQDGRAGQACRA